MLEENKSDMTHNKKNEVTPKNTPYSKRLSKRKTINEENNEKN